MRPIVIVRLGVLGLLLTGIAAHFRLQEARRSMAQGLAEIGRQNRRGAEQLRDAQRVLAETEIRNAAPLNPSTADVILENPSSLPVPPAMPRKNLSELAADNPALDAFRVQANVAFSRRRLLAFYRLRGLTPEQVRRYEQMGEHYLGQLYDLTAIAQKQDATGKQTVTALRRKSQEALATESRELLGEEGETALREYNRTQRVRDALVYGFAGVATLEGVPLTQAQGDQLFDAALHSSRAAPDATAMDILKAIDWRAYRAEARRILSPEQFGLMESRSVSTGYGSFTSEELAAAVARAVATDAAAQHGQP